MHSTLARQINKKGIDIRALPATVQDLLATISQTYENFDKDRDLTEHSLEISSRELSEKNKQLEERLSEIESGEEKISKLEEINSAIHSKELKGIPYEVITRELAQNLTQKDFTALLDALDKTSLVSMTDNKGNIIYANNKFVAVSKYSLDELIGQNHRILKSGLQPQQLFDELWKTISKGEIWRGEIHNRAKDGSYYWVDTSIAPILNSSGVPERYIAVRFLITERKEKEESFSGLLTALDKIALVSETDDKGNIVYANDKFVEVSKYSRNELIGQNHRILKSGLQPQELFDELWKTIASGNVWRGEIENKAKDGSCYWVDTSIAPILNSSGVPERYIAVRFVITEKKKTEQGLIAQNDELEKSKKAILNVLEDVQKEKNKEESIAHELEKFKIALDGTSDHVVITDPNGIALYANASIETITGFSPKEVIGRKVGTRELWGGQMEQSFYEELWQTIKIDKKPFVGELTNKRKDGSIYEAKTSISPIFNKDGSLEYIVGIERDITREKEIDQEKSEFISLASHQLRTPLTEINWNCEILLSGDSGRLSPEQKENIEGVYAGSQRMVKLVGALLNVSRIETGTFLVDPEPVDVLKIIRSVLDESKQKVEEKKLVITFESETIPLIPLDPNLTTIIFQNLLTNSIKYTLPGGSITVTLKIYAKGTVLSDITLEEDNLLVQVIDTGIGIPEAKQKEVFTKLFRADNAVATDQDGTGLGLYLVKSLIQHAGGKIWFTSVENKGSTFSVLIPVSGMVKKEGTKALAQNIS